MPATSAVPATPDRSGAIRDDSQYVAITAQQIAAITYDDLPGDTSTITPVAKSLESLDAAGQKRMAELRRQLADWAPGKDPSLPRRVRNLLDAAAVADITIDAYEGATAYVIFEKLTADVPHEQLMKVLAWIALHPGDENAVTTVPQLGLEGQASARQVQDRVEVYAAKLLGRLTGKIPSVQR
jgi:hypothetical protein